MRKLSLDPGFGRFKIAEVKGKSVTYNVIPAVVGLGHLQDQGLLSTGLPRSHRGQEKPTEITINGQGYLVGRNVHKFKEPTSRTDYQRLSNGPELRALVYTTLATRLNSGPYICSLLIGLPVEIMQDRSHAQKTLYALRSWLTGEHSFTMASEQYTITVDKIKAMAQPLGSYFAFGLNERGQWDSSRADFEAPAAVADIGFNTVDLFGIEAGQLVSRFTGGDRLGMHRAAREIKAQILDRFRVKLSLHEADEMIRRYAENKPALVYHAGGTDDVSELVKSALTKCFSDVNDFVDYHLGQSGFRYLILTGGGAMALRHLLAEQYPTAIIPQDPVTANAIGLAKFAVRDGVLD